MMFALAVSAFMCLALLAAAAAFSGDAAVLRRAGVAKEASAVPRVVSRRPPAFVVRALGAAGGLAVGFAVAGPPGGVAGAVAALAGPVVLRRRRHAQDRERMEEQLADGVGVLAAGLRAGLSLSKAIRFAADEGEPPLADVLRNVCDREAMGVPLARSLDVWASEGDSPDVRLVVSVLQMHRRTGGDLPRVLDQLTETLRDRRSSSREVRSLTAQARLSGVILGLLPVGFLVFLSALSPGDMAAAYRSPAGIAAIATGLMLQAGAFVWIRRLLRVEG